MGGRGSRRSSGSFSTRCRPVTHVATPNRRHFHESSDLCQSLDPATGARPDDRQPARGPPAWAGRQAHDLRPEHIFTDQGHSGARLDRPGLDRLRDAAAAGEFDVIAVYSPDRLARRYVYQVLLLEEFRKAGCAVEFIQRPISDDPHDQLLLQIQGAVAEYERAVLGERFRRGKLQKARAGHWVAARAPYGYRYVPKRDGVPGHLVIDEAEAAVVRMMYRWLIDDQMSVRMIIRRAGRRPWRPRSGKPVWSNTVVHRILSDPVYAGTGYANRFYRAASPDPRRRRRRPDDLTCRRERPREEWIPIPVPAIVDVNTHEHAIAQLSRNTDLCTRRNNRHFYLLRCLLTCRRCGRAMIGVSHTSEGGGWSALLQVHAAASRSAHRINPAARGPM